MSGAQLVSVAKCMACTCRIRAIRRLCQNMRRCFYAIIACCLAIIACCTAPNDCVVHTRPRTGWVTYCVQHYADIRASRAAWLLQVDPVYFVLHLKPAQATGSNRRGTNCLGASPAGGGLGLRVFPGIIPDADCVSAHSASIVPVGY
jgi:hypothetical protein